MTPQETQQQQWINDKALEQGAEVLQIFPIPLYIKKDAVTQNDILCLRDQEPLPEHDLVANWGTVSKNNYTLWRPECKDLKDKLCLYVNDFANNILGHAGDFSITQSWVSVKRPYEMHQLHMHPNSIISGVLYYDNQGPEGLTFIKPTAGLDVYSLKPTPNNMNNVFTHSHVKVNVENYMLVLFPSYLQHTVDMNTSQVNRYSMAFNCMPTYQLGLMNDLTQLQMPNFE